MGTLGFRLYVTVLVELTIFICVTLRPMVPILVIVTFALGGVVPRQTSRGLQNQTFSIAKNSLNLLVLVVETDDNTISDDESLLLAHKTIPLPITATPPIKIAEAITVLTPMCLF